MSAERSGDSRLKPPPSGGGAVTKMGSLRRYTFKLYPTKSQEAAMREQARLCAVLWNALLEMRETHYRRAKLRGDKKTSLTAFDQGKDLTAMNRDPDCAEFKALGRGTQERVADMLDLAMKAFFKRAKSGAGAASGYPRYKSTRNAENIPLREPQKSGWKFYTADSRPAGDSEPIAGRKVVVGRARLEDGPRTGGRWRLTLRGVPGAIKARGKFPVTPTAMKTADVKYHGGSWWVSICVEVPERMTHGKQNLKVEFDLIDKFASVKLANGRCAPGLSDPFDKRRNGESIVATQEGEFPSVCGGSQEAPCGEPANVGKTQEFNLDFPHLMPCGEPANAGETQETLADAIQSARDRRYKRGSYRWRKEKLRIAKLKAREARQRKEAFHRWSTAIVRAAKELEIIAPPQRAMRSGKGNEQFPGAQVATIAALNRHVLSMAPAAAIQMLEYKCAEAGIACAVTRKEDHQVTVGAELKSAAIATRKAKRVTKRKQKLLEAAE